MPIGRDIGIRVPVSSVFLFLSPLFSCPFSPSMFSLSEFFIHSYPFFLVFFSPFFPASTLNSYSLPILPYSSFTPISFLLLSLQGLPPCHPCLTVLSIPILCPPSSLTHSYFLTSSSPPLAPPRPLAAPPFPIQYSDSVCPLCRFIYGTQSYQLPLWEVGTPEEFSSFSWS